MPRILVAVAVVCATLGGGLVNTPRAVAGGSGSDLGSNGQHRRPFYIFGHNPNTLGEVSGDLNAGANALEPDVMHFSDAAGTDGGENINEHAGPSGLFMYHDHVLVTTRLPTTIEDWLDSIHNRVVGGTNVAMIVFDIKSAAANEGLGVKLIQAVRSHLNHDGVGVNVIFSVGTFGDASVFNQIIPQLGAREGVMIDAENDPGAVYNYLVAHGAAGHIGYGNGSIGYRYGLAPHVLTGIDAASWIRAGQVPALAIPYAYPMDLTSDMHALITAGADGLIPDFDSPIATEGDTQEHIRTLANVVNTRDDVYLATVSADPFHPLIEAYGLQVDTQDKFGAGTNSNITFTLTGCNGTSSVTVDTSFRLHMESGDRNYVTLQSKDLGTLQSLTLSSDGAGLGSSWDPGRIEISSFGWGIPYGDHRGVEFHDSVDEGESRTMALGGWGHRCDQGITPTGTPFTATEGVSFSGQVASFGDPEPGASAAEYAATINWNDGTAPSAGTVNGAGGGTFTVNGTHRYAEEGSNIATVSILDTETDVIHTTSNPQVVFAGVTVRDAALASAAVSVNATERATSTRVVSTFTDANPSATVSDFGASINWGDGSTSSATVTASGSSFEVRGTHSYAEEGNYPVFTAVTDTGGAVTTAVGTANIVEADALTAHPQVIIAGVGVAFNAPVASFTNTDTTNTASDFTAAIDWGDGTTSAGTVGGAGGDFTVSGSHTYANASASTAKVTMSDDPPGTATATAVSPVVFCDRTLSGQQSGAVVLTGGNWCLIGASVAGAVRVSPGTSAAIFDSAIKGGLTSSNPVRIRVCGSSLGGSIAISGATGFVLLGDPGDDLCAGNMIGGSVIVSSNHAGVEVDNNSRIAGTVVFDSNSGGGPFPEDGAPAIEANTVKGSLTCRSNSPAPTNDGKPNTVGGSRTGQCTAL